MNVLDHARSIDNLQYHADSRLSWSKFKRFLESPLAFRHALENPKPATPAMAFGSLCHCLAFEPDTFADSYVVYEKLDGRTAAGKAQKAALEADTRIAVPEDDYTVAQTVASYCQRHLPERGGIAEAAFYAEVEGVPVQCKCDLITAEGQIYDLKTCASLTRCLNGLEFGDWLLGDAWYRMVIKAATGITVPPILYVLVETEPPHDTAVRHYPAELFEVCELYIRMKLNEYKRCLESGVWHGIDATPEPKQIEVRPWAVSKLQGEVLDSDEYEAALCDQLERGL